MIRNTILGAALVALTTAGMAHAVPLQFVTEFEFSADPAAPNTFPQDPDGLDGAMATLTFNFASGTMFSNNFAAAESASLTVTGASVASGNGTFDIMSPVALFTGNVQGLGGVGNFFGNFFLNTFRVPDLLRAVRFDAGSSVNAANGDVLTADILNGITLLPEGTFTQITNFDRQQFSPLNLSTSVVEVAPVPLPAALPLLLVGLAGFGAVGVRRSRRETA